MAINRNVSPIPQMCTLNTIILAENNSCTLFQFSRKIYIVDKNGQKLSLTSRLCGNKWNLKFYHTLAKWQSMKISVLFHSCAHLTLPFWIKRIPENFCAKWQKIKCGKNLKSYPLAKWQSIEISVLFHSFANLTLPLWIKRIPENFCSFPGKFTLCAKMAKN